MFDPLANARYAARFLSGLFLETGNWSDAAGAYHSRTPEHAARYRNRFDRIYQRVASLNPNADAMETAPRFRVNHFPLLQQGTQATGLGSLVPIKDSEGEALIPLDGGLRP
jgi:hypothetical protein